MTKNRYIWLDWSKAICIFTIVYGHILDDNISPSWMVQIKNVGWTYAVPLFFLLSGYLFCIKETCTRNFIANNVKKLIIPYIFFNVSSAIILFRLQSHSVWITGFKQFLTAEGHSFAGPSWFLISLFIVRLMFWGLSQTKKEAIHVAAFFSVLVSLYNPYYICFGVSSSLVAFFFFYLGTCLREYNIQSKFIGYGLIKKIIIFSIFLSIVLILERMGIRAIDTSRASIGDYGILKYILCAASCFMILSLCGIFHRFSFKLIEEISKDTIVIMGVHCTILQIIWAYGKNVPYILQICFEQPFVILTTFTLSGVIAHLLRNYTPQYIGGQR